MARRWSLISLLIIAIAALIPALRLPTAAHAEDVPIAGSSVATAVPLGDFMGMVVRDPHYEWQTNALYPGTNEPFYDKMGQMLQAAGVKWVRIEIFAEESAPASGQPDLRGVVNPAKYAYFTNVIAPRYNLKVLALLSTPLVRQRPSGTSAYTFPDAAYGTGAYINPERIEDALTVNMGGTIGSVNPYMRIWIENALQVAQALPYNPQTGAGIAAIEVMNEENRYLGGGGKGMNPDRLGDLLTKFYRTFRATYPGSATKILTGGLHPDRCDDCAVGGLNDRQYLDRIYKSAGVVAYKNANGKYPWDGVGYHPYAMEMRSGVVAEPTAVNDLFRVPVRMDAIRKVMLANGDAATKIWVTEVGDRGAPMTVDPAGDNERRQAEFMRQMYRMLWQTNAYVENVFWFKYEDFAVPRSPTAVGTENWGVVRIYPGSDTTKDVGGITTTYDTNGTPQRVKLAYNTYKDIAFNGFTYYYNYLPYVRNK